MSINSILKKKTTDFIKKNPVYLDCLTATDIIERSRLENSLYEFAKAGWHVINPKFEYVDGFHIEAIAGHLQAAYDGHIQTLLLNIPSRFMKSTLCNIFFPAWVWCRKPHLKFLNISSSEDLSIRDNLLCRKLMISPWYQKYWGYKFQISKELNTKDRFLNSAGGEKIIKSIHSSSMGEGGNFITVDDPNGQDDIYYATRREYVNQTVDATIGVRVDRVDKETRGCLIVIQQRVHQFDLTGHLLNKKYPRTVHLRLPMEYETVNPCITIPINGNKEPWKDPRTEEGQLLWPERFDKNDLVMRKLTLGTEINRQAQLQQNPTPADGNMIKKEWFRAWRLRKMPECSMIVQSWDTALSASEGACLSACTVWGIFKNEYGHNNVILLNTWSGRLEPPALREMMIKSYYNCYTSSHTAPFTNGIRPDIVLIEAAPGGIPIIKDLEIAGLPVVGFSPQHHGFKREDGSSPTHKLARTNFAVVIIQSKVVWLPTTEESDFTRLYPTGEKFITACLRCPRGEGQDIIDTTSQFFIWARMNNLIHYPGENPEAVVEIFTDDRRINHDNEIYNRV